jgi:ribosome maturation factor RimP
VAPAFFYSTDRWWRRGEKGMASPIPGIEEGIEDRVEALSLEMVELEWAGSAARPILRLRVDLPDSTPGNGVTVNDCVRVSRALEPWLDEHPDVPERYTLEVSSPGVERPLRRRRDFLRFAGSEVVVKVHNVLPGAKSRRLEGRLEGVEGGDAAGDGEGSDESGPYTVLVRLGKGTEVRVPSEEIVRAHLVFRWDDES